MSVYRVDKHEQSVVLFFSDGSVMKGVVFLSARTYSHFGQQTLVDLLREKAGFFPFRTDAGTFCVVNKANLTHLRFSPDSTEVDTVPPGYFSDVQISFVGGEQLSGQIAIDLPTGHNRLLDFVNSVRDFFYLQGSEAHYLVNTTHIRDISPC
jgi:hypothetical protein